MSRISADQYTQLSRIIGSAPTGSDDSTQGYARGDEWLDTSTQKVWKLVAEASPGNAIWKDATSTASGTHPVHLDTANPTVNDDSGAGYVVGGHWVNTTTKELFQAADVSVGAAVWRLVSRRKHFDAVVALSGGDYALPSAAFAAGAQRIWLRAGVYAEAANVVLPEEGMIAAEAGAVIDFGGGAFGVRVDGSGGVKNTTGTFSVTSGSTAVVGIGTTFTSLAANSWLFIGPDAYKIASVTDNTNLVLERAWRGPNRAGLPMFGLVLCSGVVLDGFTIRNSTSTDGGLFVRAARKNKFESLRVQACSHGVHVLDSINLLFDGLTCFAATAHDGCDIATSRSTQFAECHFYGNFSYGLRVTGGLAHKFNDCEFSSNLAGGVFVDGATTDCSFLGCGVKQNTGNGITVDAGCVRTIINSCTSAFNGGTGVSLQSNDSEIASNLIFSNAVNGLTLANANDVTITGNRVTANTSVGISIPATGVNRVRLLGNNVSSNGTNYSVAPGAGGDTTIFTGEYQGGSLTGPVRHNSGATTIPTANDDRTLGYQQGSIWVDSVAKDVYVCIKADVGLALWKQIDVSPNQSRDTPGETFLGTLLDYPASGGATAGEVQYVRVWMVAQTTFTSMRVFVDAGGTGARSVRMGIYDQATPTSTTGVPRDLVRATNAGSTAADNGLFKTLALTSNYVVPATGYYWLACVQDSASLKLAVTAAIRADFVYVRRESGTGTNLPATAGGLSNPVSALIYVSAIEV